MNHHIDEGRGWGGGRSTEVHKLLDWGLRDAKVL